MPVPSVPGPTPEDPRWPPPVRPKPRAVLAPARPAIVDGHRLVLAEWELERLEHAGGR